MDRLSFVVYAICVGITAAYLMYRQIRTSRLLEQLETVLEPHLRAWHRQPDRSRRNSTDMRFRQYYYAYEQLDRRTLASLRVLLTQSRQERSYVSGLFGLFWKVLIPIGAFLLGLAAASYEPLMAMLTQPSFAAVRDLLTTWPASGAAGACLTLLAVILVHLFFSTYVTNETTYHLLVMEQLEADRLQAQTHQPASAQAAAKQRSPAAEDNGSEQHT